MADRTTKKYWSEEELLALPDDGVKREIVDGELVESGAEDIEPGRYWTDEELLALPKAGNKREIVEGRLIMSPAGYNHGFLINRLVHFLGQCVYPQGLGELGDAQTGFRLNNGDLFSPDISFISAQRVAEMRASEGKSSFFQGVPDLAVEVLSPSDKIGVLEEKMGRLFEGGTKIIWVVYPRLRSVHVHRSIGDAKILGAGDTLDGEEVIPGFKLELSRLFV